MQFSHPDAWYWAATLLILLALYLARLGGRRREVAGFWIWQEALARRPAWFRLRFWLSLATQLLIALLLVAALTMPFWKDAVSVRRNIVLVLDTSASMSATDVEPSRFAEALLAAQRAVQTLQLGERMAIVTAGSAVRTECQLTEDHQRLQETVAGLVPSGGRARVAEAEAMARRMLADQPNPRVFVISDGGFDGVRKIAEKPEVTLHLVGGSHANVAITRFEARPSATAVQDYDVLIDVGNFSETPRSGTLRLLQEDRTVWQQRVDLAAGQSQQLVPAVPVRESTRLDARLDGGDDLALDDFASLLVEAQRIPLVHLAETGDAETRAAIGNALRSDPRIRLAAAGQTPPAGASYAPVRVLYREVPRTLPPGPLLVIDPEQACDAWQLGPTVSGDDCLVRVYREDLPLLAGVRIDEVVFERLRRLEFALPASTLIESRDGSPLISLLDRPAGNVLVLHVGLRREQSDLVLRAEFPRLLLNAVWWLSGATVPYRAGITTDTILSFAPADQARSFLRPDGSAVPLAAGRSFALADRPGLWRLTGEAEGDGDPRDAMLVASSLVAPTESDLRLPAGLSGDAFEVPRFVEEYPIWLQIAALVLVILVVEWFLYHRRLVV